MWLSAGLSLAGAVVFAWVGWVVGHRSGGGEGDGQHGSQLAVGMFSVWWYALATLNALEGITKVWVAVEEPVLSLVVAAQLLGFLCLCVALTGLLHYLVYLFSGRDDAFWPLVIGYGALGGWMVRAAVAQEPVAVRLTPWRVILSFDQPASPVVALLPIVFLLLPQLLASVALFGLAPRLPRGMLRVRGLVTAGSLMVWLGGTVFATLSGVGDEPTRVIGQALLGILAGSAILVVHRPPRWLRAKLPPETVVSHD